MLLGNAGLETKVETGIRPEPDQDRPFVNPLWISRKRTYSGRDLSPGREDLTHASGGGACSFSGESDTGLDEVDDSAETDKGE